MTSVFTAIPLTSAGPFWRGNKRSTPSRPSATRINSKESTSATHNGEQGGITKEEEPDLRNLNESLEALVAIFPDVQAEVFREMLLSFQPESRLQVVTEALLKHKAKYVRGRWRVEDVDRSGVKAQETRTGRDMRQDSALQLPVEQRFRTTEYRTAVWESLSQEFKGLNRSTIRGVLAEHNHSYTHARVALMTLSTSLWSFTITRFLMRQKKPSTESNPHVVTSFRDWPGGREVVARLKPTLSMELDRELYDTLIAPLEAASKREIESYDRNLAERVNTQAAEEVRAMYDCECCFTATTFEELSVCDDERGHNICFRCVRHAVNESLYGQSWTRNVDASRCTLRCIAPVADHRERECVGMLPAYLVQRALSLDPASIGSWKKFQERMAEEALLKSKVPLIRCPFCAYAEVDDFGADPRDLRWRLKKENLILPLSLLALIYSSNSFLTICLLMLIYSLLLPETFKTYSLFAATDLGIIFRKTNVVKAANIDFAYPPASPAPCSVSIAATAPLASYANHQAVTKPLA